MSDVSEDHGTSDDSGSDYGSPAESGEDGRVSPRSRKCPAGSLWSFSGTFTVQTTEGQPSLSPDEVASKTAALFQHVFLDREEAKEYLGKHFVKFMIVLFDRSKTDCPASHEDECYQYRIPVRGYLECKRITIHNLYAWMPEKLIPDLKWSAIPCQLPEHKPYLDDMSRILDMRQPWGTLFRAGRNASPRNEGRVWVFTGKIICDTGDISDGAERIAIVKDYFRATYLSDDSHERQRPHQIKNMLILCNAMNLMESSSGTTSIEIRGYIQSKNARLSLWKAWLPPEDFEWRRVQGRLHQDPQFQADTSDLSPSADAGSSSRATSQWVLLLSEGKGDLLTSASSSRGAKKVGSDSRLLLCR